MPLHDWTRVPSGLFHDFHQSWTVRISDAINAGRLPKGASALLESNAMLPMPDALTIEARNKRAFLVENRGVIAQRPVTQFMCRSTKDSYANRANRIVIKHHLGRILAVIEIISPGNKDSRAARRDFTEKTLEYLKAGIHVLVVDLFPPSPRDPFGIHKVIWDEFEEEPFTLPEGKDRILASYETGGERAAYIEPVGVGDELPEMPLFLSNTLHVRVPLEPTYMATWEASPEVLRIAVETGELPQIEEE